MAHTKEKRLPPIHPGEVLQDLFDEAGLTPNASQWLYGFRRTGLEAS